MIAIKKTKIKTSRLFCYFKFNTIFAKIENGKLFYEKLLLLENKDEIVHRFALSTIRRPGTFGEKKREIEKERESR